MSAVEAPTYIFNIHVRKSIYKLQSFQSSKGKNEKL